MINENFSFHLELLIKIIEMEQYPFTKMVIEKRLTEEEYKETMRLLETLSYTYKEDRESGFLDHSFLLFHYAGMVCPKLPVRESLEALYKEGLYPDLTKQLLQIHHM